MVLHSQEERLLERYWQTRSIEDRNKAVEAHLRYAAMIARRFSGKGVEYDELYQVASLSLIKAMERFDPSKDVKFTTFAMPTKTGLINVFLPNHAKNTVKLSIIGKIPNISQNPISAAIPK